MDFFRHLLPNGGSGGTLQMDATETGGSRGCTQKDNATGGGPTNSDRGSGRSRERARVRDRVEETGDSKAESRNNRLLLPTSPPRIWTTPPHVMELLRATARLAIRLEDQQSLDRLDKAFLIHQRSAKNGRRPELLCRLRCRPLCE